MACSYRSSGNRAGRTRARIRCVSLAPTVWIGASARIDRDFDRRFEVESQLHVAAVRARVVAVIEIRRMARITVHHVFRIDWPRAHLRQMQLRLPVLPYPLVQLPVLIVHAHHLRIRLATSLEMREEWAGWVRSTEWATRMRLHHVREAWRQSPSAGDALGAGETGADWRSGHSWHIAMRVTRSE